MKRKIFDKKMIVLIIFQFIFSVVVVFIAFDVFSPVNENHYTNSLRDTGTKLHASGITKEAILKYQQYLEYSNVNSTEYSKLAYTIGTMYEETGGLEKALSWFYQVESVDSNSKYKKDANKRIVSLLEKLGKHSAAKYALKDSTSINKSNKKNGGVIVAKIEGSPIYLHQIDSEIDRLPPQIKQQFKSKKGRIQYVQKYIADELMLKKARKLRLDESDEYRKRLADIEKQLLVQEIVKSEIQGKVTVAESDMKNYFKANNEKYVLKDRAEILQVKVKTKKIAKQVSKGLSKGKNIQDIIKQYSVDKNTSKIVVTRGVPFLGEDTKNTHKILKVKERKWTGPILNKGYFYIVYVIKKHKGVTPTYDQIKKQVATDYKTLKAQELYQEMIGEILKTDDVKLFVENIK